MNEIKGTRPNSCSQAFARWHQEVKTSSMVFKYFSSGWILMVPKNSLLKYFTLTFTRQKSSKFKGSGPPLRWGWVFLERTRILCGIQFTTHFIDFFVVQTKPFVGNTVHVILAWQTCGQRSSKAAESKRRALGNYFSERICYMFLISKCREDQDLGLCTTWGLAFGEPQRTGKIRFLLRRNTFFSRILPLCCGSPNASTEVVHKPRSRSPLHFDIRNI